MQVPNTDTVSVDTAAVHRILPRELASLRHDGTGRAELKYLADAARAELERQEVHVAVEEMADDEIEQAVNGGTRGPLRQLLAIVGALLVEIDLPRENTQAIRLLPDGRLRIGRRELSSICQRCL
jgi:hypothetical protein